MSDATTRADDRFEELQDSGHPMIAPEQPSEELLDTVHAALAHRMPLNRHLTVMVRAAADPAVAHGLFLTLSHYTASTFFDSKPADSWTCPACTVESYAKQGLLDAEDELALTTAQSRAAVLACGFGVPSTEDELTLLHHDPQALVRAAYALGYDRAL